MPNPLLIQGNQQIQRRDYGGAIATFTQLINSDPYHAEAFCRRAVAYFQSGNIHAAVSDYGKVLDLAPQHPKAHYGRALARFTLKNPTGAMTDIQVALQWKPEYAAAYQLRAKIHRQQSDFENAIADFKQAAKFYIEARKSNIAKDCIQAVKQIQDQLKRVQSTQGNAQASWTEQHYFEHVMSLVKQGKQRQAI